MSATKLIWISGPHAFENPKPLDQLVAKLAAIGIGRLMLLTDGAPGVSKLVQEVAEQRSVHVLEMKPRWGNQAHQADSVRDLFLAQSLPVDHLIAITFTAPFSHREVTSAMQAAKAYDIPIKTLRVKPEVAMPSLTSPSAPGNRKRRKRAKKTSA